MVDDDEKHKSVSSRRDYMREYMRRRRSQQQQPPAHPTELHGPPAPPNLPRGTRVSKVAVLRAHLDYVLNLWSETGKELAKYQELAKLKGVDEMLNTIDSLMLENKRLKDENKHLQDEVENLREALKTCQSKPQEPETQALKPEEPQPATDLQPSKPLEPGLVDPDRRPSPADDTPADWMM